MDTNLTAALIGAGGTVFGAVIGAVLAQTNIVDRIFRPSHFTSLLGKWDSTWSDLDDPDKIVLRETFVITRQKGSRVTGLITMDTEPDKKWQFEGNFSGRFLQLFYYPAKDSDDRLFLDYGCYFFDMQGDGSFKGYSVGFDWSENSTDISEHRLKRVK